MSSFHCPWYFKNSWGSKMFNNYSEKLKNENCAQCNHSYERKKIYKDVWMREWDEYCNDGWMFLNKCPTMMCLAKKKKEKKKECPLQCCNQFWQSLEEGATKRGLVRTHYTPWCRTRLQQAEHAGRSCGAATKILEKSVDLLSGEQDWVGSGQHGQGGLKPAEEEEEEKEMITDNPRKKIFIFLCVWGGVWLLITFILSFLLLQLLQVGVQWHRRLRLRVLQGLHKTLIVVICTHKMHTHTHTYTQMSVKKLRKNKL